MKFTCPRQDLAKAAVAAHKAVKASRGQSLWTAGTHMTVEDGLLKVAGAGFDYTIETTIRDVENSENGTAVVSAPLLSSVLKVLDSETVTAEPDDEEFLKVTAEGTEYALAQHKDASSWQPPAFPDSTAITVDGPALAQAVKLVAPAASSDQTRPMLTTVNIQTRDSGGVRLAATDSFRLATAAVPDIDLLPDSLDGSANIPAGALAEAAAYCAKTDKAEAVFDHTQVLITAGDTRLLMRLVEGKYPNYRQLLPDSTPRRLVCDRAALQAAVRRAGVMLNKSETPLRLRLTDDGPAEMSARSDDGHVSDAIECDYTGDPLDVAFNPSYLSDGLEAAATEQVEMGLTDELKPALLRPLDPPAGAPEYLYLIMPVRAR